MAILPVQPVPFRADPRHAERSPCRILDLAPSPEIPSRPIKGRGAVGNVANRYSSAQRQAEDDSPVGQPGDVTLLIDESLLAFDTLWAAAGHPHAVFRLTPAQLLRLTGAQAVDVAQQ